MGADKNNLCITIGVCVHDESKGSTESKYYQSGIVYNNAGLDTMQSVHGIEKKLFELMEPALEELKELGDAQLVKKHFHDEEGKKEKKKK